MRPTIRQTDAENVEVTFPQNKLDDFHNMLMPFTSLFTGKLIFDYDQGKFVGSYSFDGWKLCKVFVELYIRYMRGKV